MFIDDKDEMVVTWATQKLTSPSVVEYGWKISNLSMTVQGQQPTPFTDGGPQNRTIYVHRVVLKNLKPAQTYCKYGYEDMSWPRVEYIYVFRLPCG